VSEPVRPASASEGIAAFDDVYEREFDYVCRNLGRLGVPQGDLDDAAHEVFLVLYRRWGEVDPARPIRPWLFGVARRVAADARAKRREVVSELPDVSEPVDPLAAQRDLVWHAMRALDDDRRVVIVLHDFEGHTGAEIAAMLDIPVNTVHSRLRLAREDLLAAVQRLRGER
jgi:RNA polymerase sigma-70 factor (ECF subfamily)